MMKYMLLIIGVVAFIWYLWLFNSTPKEENWPVLYIESGEEIVKGWSVYDLQRLFTFTMDLSNLGFSPTLEFDELNGKVTVRINIKHTSQENIDKAQKLYRDLKMEKKLEFGMIIRGE